MKYNAILLTRVTNNNAEFGLSCPLWKFKRNTFLSSPVWPFTAICLNFYTSCSVIPGQLCFKMLLAVVVHLSLVLSCVSGFSLIGDKSTTIHKTPIQLLEIKKKVGSKWRTFLFNSFTLART